MNNDIEMINVRTGQQQSSNSEHVIDIEVAPELPGRIDTVGIETAITDLTDMLGSKSFGSSYHHRSGYDGWITLAGLGVVSLIIWLMFIRVVDELKVGGTRISDSIKDLKAPCNCVCPKQMICNSTFSQNITMATMSSNLTSDTTVSTSSITETSSTSVPNDIATTVPQSEKFMIRWLL